MSVPADTDRRESMLAAILHRLQGCRTIAVGASSPIPAAAALLARANWGAQVLMLGHRALDQFTEGGRELFDCAAQGRIDAFFLSGGQIDGEANVNLLGTGPYPDLVQRFPGSFGSTYLYFLVPRVILFREEHSPRTMPARVDVISAPGMSPPGVYRPGGPVALVTGRAVLGFDSTRGTFTLESVHGGETPETVREATGFDYHEPPTVLHTPPLAADDRLRLRGPVAEELGQVYPRFAAMLAAA